MSYFGLSACAMEVIGCFGVETDSHSYIFCRYPGIALLCFWSLIFGFSLLLLVSCLLMEESLDE